jgi:hypothetical protein
VELCKHVSANAEYTLTPSDLDMMGSFLKTAAKFWRSEDADVVLSVLARASLPQKLLKRHKTFLQKVDEYRGFVGRCQTRNVQKEPVNVSAIWQVCEPLIKEPNVALWDEDTLIGAINVVSKVSHFVCDVGGGKALDVRSA